MNAIYTGIASLRYRILLYKLAKQIIIIKINFQPKIKPRVIEALPMERVTYSSSSQWTRYFLPCKSNRNSHWIQSKQNKQPDNKPRNKQNIMLNNRSEAHRKNHTYEVNDNLHKEHAQMQTP